MGRDWAFVYCPQSEVCLWAYEYQLEVMVFVYLRLDANVHAARSAPTK